VIGDSSRHSVLQGRSLLQYLTRSALSRCFVMCRIISYTIIIIIITSYTCIQTFHFSCLSLRQYNTHKTSSFHQTFIIILTQPVKIMMER